ncbi:tyrosine-type recombinase/integrase [Psychrobacter sp. ER1]|uniref:tyrosine-type recombinase/integrase n=1 Tax=Psychrobacter sp. ER1 TaxID=3406645 RepID=UPI003B42FE1A
MSCVSALQKHARKYVNPDQTPAFFNAKGTPYTRKAINELLERLSKRAIKKGRLDRVISPHKLRHGNAYAILQSNDLGSDYLDRLVIVQKNLGHNHLSTTQMYTSIPQEIYNTICDENGDLLTRAEKMRRLSEQTQLKIGIKDIK